MVTVRAPIIKAPWPPTRWGDKFFRYPTPYRVGKERGESFSTIAKKHGVNAADLVRYNFQTTSGDEINWYLANYVGCPTPKPGQQFYTFEGASYDPTSNTGVIFIPTFGESSTDYVNRFGQKIVENYNKTLHKEPGGRCYEACYTRVSVAAKQVGVALPALDHTSDFGRLWGSYIKPKETWLKLSEDYRGKGAAGAMASAGLGALVDSEGIWTGKLKPGAVIQTWKTMSDYERVRDGDAVVDGSYGHSFIFLNYVYSGSAISGLAIADQGFQNGDPLAKGEYGFWVGANLVASA